MAPLHAQRPHGAMGAVGAFGAVGAIRAIGSDTPLIERPLCTVKSWNCLSKTGFAIEDVDSRNFGTKWELKKWRAQFQSDGAE